MSDLRPEPLPEHAAAPAPPASAHSPAPPASAHSPAPPLLGPPGEAAPIPPFPGDRAPELAILDEPSFAAAAVSSPPASSQSDRASAPRRRLRPLMIAGWVAAGLGGLLTLVAPRFPFRGSPALQHGHSAELIAPILSALQDAERDRNWAMMQERAQELLTRIPAAQPATGPRSRPSDKESDSDIEVLRRAQRALTRATTEQQNLLLYDRFLQAAATGAHDAAVLAYGELSEDSVYRELGANRYQEMRLRFVASHSAQARTLARRSCREAAPHVDAVLAVWPAAAADPAVRALAARCGSQPLAPDAATAAPGAPGDASDPSAFSAAPGDGLPGGAPYPDGPGLPGALGATARRDAPAQAVLLRRDARGRATPHAISAGRGKLPPQAAAPDTTAASGAASSASSLDDAQQAYIAGDYQSAITIARQHLRRSAAGGEARGPTAGGREAHSAAVADRESRSGSAVVDRAWRVIGGAACYLGDAALVRETLGHLDGTSQRYIHLVCQRSGLTL